MTSQIFEWGENVKVLVLIYIEDDKKCHIKIAFILRRDRPGDLRLMSSWQNMAMVSVILFLTVQQFSEAKSGEY